MGGEAGNGVHLVEQHLAPGSEEQVHPGKAPAVQRPVDSFGRLLDFLRFFRRNPGRTVDGGGLEGVLLSEVEKAAAQFDLIHPAQGGVFIAQHGAPHLEAVHRLLQQHFPVMAEGLLHRRQQPGGLCHPADAEGGAGPHWLDEQGVAQCVCRGLNVRPVCPGGKHEALGGGHTGQGGQPVGAVLVHAQGAG